MSPAQTRPRWRPWPSPQAGYSGRFLGRGPSDPVQSQPAPALGDAGNACAAPGPRDRAGRGTASVARGRRCRNCAAGPTGGRASRCVDDLMRVVGLGAGARPDERDDPGAAQPGSPKRPDRTAAVRRGDAVRAGLVALALNILRAAHGKFARPRRQRLETRAGACRDRAKFAPFAGNSRIDSRLFEGVLCYSSVNQFLPPRRAVRSAVSGALQCNRRSIGRQQTTRRT